MCIYIFAAASTIVIIQGVATQFTHLAIWSSDWSTGIYNIFGALAWFTRQALAFPLANILWVSWLRLSVDRHFGRDDGVKFLPEGAERLPQLVESSVWWCSCLLLVITNPIYLIVFLFESGNYGESLALIYFT